MNIIDDYFKDKNYNLQIHNEIWFIVDHLCVNLFSNSEDIYKPGEYEQINNGWVIGKLPNDHKK